MEVIAHPATVTATPPPEPSYHRSYREKIMTEKKVPQVWRIQAV